MIVRRLPKGSDEPDAIGKALPLIRDADALRLSLYIFAICILLCCRAMQGAAIFSDADGPPKKRKARRQRCLKVCAWELQLPLCSAQGACMPQNTFDVEMDMFRKYLGLVGDFFGALCRLALASLALLASGAWAQVGLPLNAGWNLVGNGYYASVDVATFAPVGASPNIFTIWKWLPASGQWAFYAPGFSDGGKEYGAGRGYVFLTTIEPGEGFWINAATQTTLQLHGTTPPLLPTAAFQAGGLALPHGWSLIAVADAPTPREFANGIADALPCPGTAISSPLCPDKVAASSLTSLWAWNTSPGGWRFYSPSLDNQGTLAGYVSSKNYLDFAGAASALGPTQGFWVNRP